MYCSQVWSLTKIRSYLCEANHMSDFISKSTVGEVIEHVLYYQVRNLQKKIAAIPMRQKHVSRHRWPGPPPLPPPLFVKCGGKKTLWRLLNNVYTVIMRTELRGCSHLGAFAQCLHYGLFTAALCKARAGGGSRPSIQLSSALPVNLLGTAVPFLGIKYFYFEWVVVKTGLQSS